MRPQISIIIPLFNEENVFEALITRVNQVVLNSELNCEVLLINDGSSDRTGLLMEELALNNSMYNCIFLSKNHGHQIALSAGLAKARATEGVFILDGDLQDPPELLTLFYGKLNEGYDVVYAIRKKRKESFLKRTAYFVFYRLLDKISDLKIPLDSGDFGMMSRRVVDILNSMPEHSRYVRGMRAWVGFKQVGIPYEREERQEGETKYSFKMLIKLAKEGVFNFSEFPIILITRLGILSFSVASFYFITVLFKMIFYSTVPEGYTSLLLAIILFSGVILMSLGIIGEYILRIFKESGNRPLFIIEKQILDGKKTDYSN
jgi:glycosyltransferase involved in cell wall biosynthesis